MNSTVDKATQEEIQEFLHGNDPEKYIVALEFGYRTGKIYKIKEYDKIRIKNNYGIIGSHFLKAKERVQKDLILAVSKEEKFVTKCTAGNLSYVGMEDGSLKPCEILSNKIGNFATQNNMDALYKSKEAKELRNFIVDTKCKCTYECSMSTNTLFNGNMFVKLLKQTTKDILHL